MLPSIQYTGFPGSTVVRTHLSMWARQEMQVQSLGREEPLEEEMATHSSILAWRIPWTEEPGGLQSMGSLRVACDLGTNTFFFFHQATNSHFRAVSYNFKTPKVNKSLGKNP